MADGIAQFVGQTVPVKCKDGQMRDLDLVDTSSNWIHGFDPNLVSADGRDVWLDPDYGFYEGRTWYEHFNR